MGRIRRSFDISFKIRVCEAIDRGERTVLEVCREYQVQRPVVEGWLQKFVQGELEPKKFESTESAQIREIEKLKAKVGELTMQIDAFKKTAKEMFPHSRKRSQEKEPPLRASGNSSDLNGLRVKQAILLPAPSTTRKKDKH